MALTIVSPVVNTQGQAFVPASVQSNWVALITDPQTADTVNLLIPSSVTRSGQNQLQLPFSTTGVQFLLRYQTGQATGTALIVKVIGIDANGVPQPLQDANGNLTWTFTAAASTDLQDANGNSYTPANTVDVLANKLVMALVTQALVGGGTINTATGPQLMMRPLN